MQLGTLPGVEKVLVVIPVVPVPVSVAAVMLELSSEMVAYWLAFVPEFSPLRSMLTFASAALLGAAALYPINSEYAPEIEVVATTPFTRMLLKTGFPALFEHVPE